MEQDDTKCFVTVYEYDEYDYYTLDWMDLSVDGVGDNYAENVFPGSDTEEYIVLTGLTLNTV